MKSRYPLPLIASLVLVLSLPSCTSISLFSATAYEQVTGLKGEALILIDKASEPFVQHQDEVEALMLKTEKAYEFARGRPKNAISTRQWEILKDPNRNLLGGFLKRWEENSTLSRAFIDEAKKLVAEAFDTIIGLESGKLRPGDVQ